MRRTHDNLSNGTPLSSIYFKGPHYPAGPTPSNNKQIYTGVIMKESSPSIKPGDVTDLHNHISARKISNKLKDFAMVDYV